MKRRLPLLAGLLGLFAAAAVCGAADSGSPASYPWRKILTRQNGEGALGTVPVDRELAVKGVAHANSALFTPEGTPVPFRFEPVTISVERKSLGALGLVSKPYYSSDRTPGVVFDNPARETIEGVELRTAERDFDKLVRIETSEDGVHFQPLGPDQPFFDYSRVGAEQRVLTFPPATPRYLRIRVMDYPEERPTPGSVVEGGLIPGGGEYARRRIRIERFAALAGRTVQAWEPLTGFISPLESSRREVKTRSIVDGRFEPEKFSVLQVEIVSKQPFARSVECYGSMDGKKFLFLGRVFCRRLTAGGGKGVAKLPLDGRRFPHYRVEVENGGNPPLDEIRFLAGAERSRIVFESREPELIFAYGGDSAVVRPESRAEGECASYSAGPEEPNPAYETGGINWTRWILATTVGIMLIVLITLLWRGYQSIVK